VRLFCSRTALAPVAIPLTGLPLHRNVLHRASIVVPLLGLPLHRHALRRLSIAGLDIYAEFLLYKGQLLVELASCFCEFVAPRTPLGVGAAVAWCWLRFGAACRRGHTDVALSRGVVVSHGPCPSSRRRPRGSADHAEVVDVGRHWIVREDGLSTGVHCDVPFHELRPAQRSVSASLEGEVGEVVRGEPKTLLRWVWPQHAEDDVV
jgi:hypothetical protein